MKHIIEKEKTVKEKVEVELPYFAKLIRHSESYYAIYSADNEGLNTQLHFINSKISSIHNFCKPEKAFQYECVQVTEKEFIHAYSVALAQLKDKYQANTELRHTDEIYNNIPDEFLTKEEILAKNQNQKS